MAEAILQSLVPLYLTGMPQYKPLLSEFAQGRRCFGERCASVNAFHVIGQCWRGVSCRMNGGNEAHPLVTTEDAGTRVLWWMYEY